MRKVLLIFVGFFVAAQQCASAAVTIKKAAPVATKQTSVKDTGASLLPSVLNLVSGVQQLSQKQKALTDDCIPTSQEITWVNNMVKEWAKTGDTNSDDVEKAMDGMERCSSANGGYEASVRMAADIDDYELCYDYFDSSADKGTVWHMFPKASKAYYCKDGEVTGCKEKNRVYMSNIYDVFNMIDFSENDYTTSELTMASKLMAKIENCSNAKISAKKRAMWGEFLMSSVGSVGQKTNTGNIMQVVQGVSGSVGNGSGFSGALQSLSGIANQFIPQ